MSTSMYAGAILQASARGDLAEMKKLLAEAEEHLEEWGDMKTAVELLKLEIAKQELRGAGE